MTIRAGGLVDSTDFAVLAALAAPWTTWTPAVSNATGEVGGFAYVLLGSTFIFRGRLTAGTATAAGSIGVALPAGITNVNATQVVLGIWNAANPTYLPAQVAANATEITVWRADGTAFSAGGSINGVGLSGAIEVA